MEKTKESNSEKHIVEWGERNEEMGSKYKVSIVQINAFWRANLQCSACIH
jgi:hypothetical protein